MIYKTYWKEGVAGVTVVAFQRFSFIVYLLQVKVLHLFLSLNRKFVDLLSSFNLVSSVLSLYVAITNNTRQFKMLQTFNSQQKKMTTG